MRNIKDRSSPRKSIVVLAKMSIAAERYIEDMAMFVAPTAVVNPMAGLNNVLAGASALSATDLRKASGQACEVALSVCKPIRSSNPYSTSIDTARYAAMAKAFDSLSSQGGVYPI